jgi:hypothetical protein
VTTAGILFVKAMIGTAEIWNLRISTSPELVTLFSWLSRLPTETSVISNSCLTQAEGRFWIATTLRGSAKGTRHGSQTREHGFYGF